MATVMRFASKAETRGRSELWYRRIFENAYDAILVLNPRRNRILDVNPMACHILEYAREELLAQAVSQILGTGMSEFTTFAQSVFDRNYGCTGEFICFTKAGRAIPAEISASMIDTEEGASILALVRSATERKRRETELIDTCDELKKKLRESTSQFLKANALLRQEIPDGQRVEQLREINCSNLTILEGVRDDVFGFGIDPDGASAFTEIVGQGSAIRRVVKQIEQVAPTPATVLIVGESGTGKELVARAIHEHSPRRRRPLIKVNCAAIPRELFESEFFGHVKGAFSGAHNDRTGRFELADGGTLFLDEVGELSIELQSKLLRVLEEGCFERVGEGKSRNVDVRVIAATNRDLTMEIDAQRFRKDLFYRLNVFPIKLPPLRERCEDIPLLANHILGLVGRKLGRTGLRLTQAHVRELQGYDWPGNIRELRNVMERAAIIADAEHSLQFDIPTDGPCVAELKSENTEHRIITERMRRELDRRNIVSALQRANGKISGPGSAAELLGTKPTTLRSRIKALGIRSATR